MLIGAVIGLTVFILLWFLGGWFALGVGIVACLLATLVMFLNFSRTIYPDDYEED